MSDLADAYGLLFIGFVVVIVFLTCYKVISNNDHLIKNVLESQYLASKFKTELSEYNSSMSYNKTFALPKFDVFKQEMITVISYE